MFSRVKELCAAYERLAAAPIYGSFAKSEGDEFSNIEFHIFVRDEALAGFDSSAWIARVAPRSEWHRIRGRSTRRVVLRDQTPST